jgi:ABC-type Mn2+/Zn2+ transport system permease subunit
MLGITLSYKLDLPTAPLIVASLSVAFFVLLVVRQLSSKPGMPRERSGG